jgi:tetratricopeptide (TPR) repeat protein
MQNPRKRAAAEAMRNGQSQDAERLCREILAENPDDEDGLIWLGLLLLQSQNLAEAEACLARAFSLRPHQVPLANNLGMARQKMGNQSGAIAAFNESVNIDPTYRIGWSNLGRALAEADHPHEALNAFRRAHELAPSSETLTALGAAQMAADDYTAAEASLRNALALNLDNTEARTNLALCLDRTGRAFAVPEILGTPAADEPPNLALARALAHHRVGDQDTAIKQLQCLIDRHPGHLETHEALKRFLWLRDASLACLEPLQRAAQARPNDLALHLRYAESLLQLEQPAEALKVIAGLPTHLKTVPGVVQARGVALLAAGSIQEALTDLRAAARQSGHVRPRLALSRALLASGRADEALEELTSLQKLRPKDQEILAYVGTALRLLNHPGSDAFHGIDDLISDREIPLPPGFSTHSEFNEALVALLDERHAMAAHPVEQTLRGGTQTDGDLFQSGPPQLLQLLKDSLIAAVQDFIEELEPSSDHPLLMRLSSSFSFRGGWSVRLRAGGFHTNHVHSRGWLSSAYYVALPPSVASGDGGGGQLQFGVPDARLGIHLAPLRVIQPKAGHLVLFPSYLWHGTTQFLDSAPRLTVAFDVVPNT